MLEKLRKFDKNIPSPDWLYIALAAALTFYLVLIGVAVLRLNVCEYLGIDYCAYWAGGRLINERGFALVYDLDLLRQYQKDVFPYYISSSVSFSAIPLPYLPVFILPFQLLSMIPMPSSYFVWILINFVGLILYLRFFTKAITGHPLPSRLLMMVLLSLPVFLNFREGQLNVWLSICAGEFIRATLSEKPLKAGLWLGGWLLKPQILVLIIPFLLIKRSVKVLSGFFLSSITVLMISLGLVGVNGFKGLINILLESAQGGATSNPMAMMNWRMLGVHLDMFTSSSIGLPITIVASLLTGLLALFIFSKKTAQDSTSMVVAFLGLFAATCAIAWHAHFHTALILIPPMVLLIMNDRFNKKIFIAWVFLPVFIELLIFIIAGMSNAGILSKTLYNLIRLMDGLRGLVLNLAILGWAMVQFVRLQKDSSGDRRLENGNFFQ